MADDTKTPDNSFGDVTDSSKGAILPDGKGGVTLDAPSKNRDAIPSPVENRDSVRNADDATSAPTTETAQRVATTEELMRAGWQVGQFDSGTGAGGDVLSNLAFPSELAVNAERITPGVNPEAKSVVGGAEYSDDKYDDAHGEAFLTSEPEDRVTVEDKVKSEDTKSDDADEVKSDEVKSEAKTPAPLFADKTEEEEKAPADDKPESELTPQEKRARTLAEKKAKEAEAAKDSSTS